VYYLALPSRRGFAILRRKGGRVSLPSHLEDDPAELRRSVERFSLLLDLSRALASELDLDRLLHTIVERTSEVLDADRCTLFIVDEERDEVWSRVAQGDGISEVRVPRQVGIVGHVATTGETINVPEAYADPRFNRDVDKRTGYHTRTILTMPVRNTAGVIIAFVQVLNKRTGVFTDDDESLLGTICDHAAVALMNASLLDAHRKETAKSNVLLDVMRSLSTKLEIDQLLESIVAKTTEVMQAERSSLFLVDRANNTLVSKVAEGTGEVRIPIGVGIAGYVAETGETVNIPDAYQDPRFNPDFDRQTGFRTHSILCMPMRNAEGGIVGVLQVLNKRGGVFTAEDEELLSAIGSQEVIAINNAHLFEEVVRMKNYNESVLRSMATGVVTLDQEACISTVNPSAVEILGLNAESSTSQRLQDIIGIDENRKFLDLVLQALKSGKADKEQDIHFWRADGNNKVFNTWVEPLLDHKAQHVGAVLGVEDISREQRLIATLSRVVSRDVAKQIIESGAMPSIGGERKKVTVLMADIRNFTPMTEKLRTTPEEVVAMLNEYFGHMIQVIFRYGGTLDKFIGDSIMAVFGTPIAHADDPVRAVMAGVEMRRALHALNATRVAAGKEIIEIGVGISDGEAISGAIGSDERLDLTVIGDTVNTAARLEKLTKLFPAHKLVFDQPVWEAVKNLVQWEKLTEEQVKGKEEAIQIYGISESFILSGAQLDHDLAARTLPG
jgi:adenylate cyclase